jgi:pseudouridine-5'-phosphate glycosidase/pseudouridine kinase
MTHISPNTLELDVLHDILSSPSISTSSSSAVPVAVAEAASEHAWAYINSLNLTADYRARLDAFLQSAKLDWLREEGIVQKATGLLPYFGNMWIKSGARGVVRVAVLPDAEAGSSGSTSSSATAPVYGMGDGVRPTEGENGGNRMVYPLSGVHPGKSLVIAHYPAPVMRPEEIISTTGAGDSLVGGLVAGLVKGLSEEEMVRDALDRVSKSLRSRRAVA